MAEDKIFADGFSFKRRENAPDFVVGQVSIKVEDAGPFIKKNMKNGWINLNINKARSGNYYVELDTWEPSEKKEKAVKKTDDLPF
tara:strand:+ start:3244 stop:3498 length:255 start_codon:yes stop_codon:yes gene_type:complete